MFPVAPFGQRQDRSQGLPALRKPPSMLPGRERLFASPSATGSPDAAPMTMGMVRVALNAASMPFVESVTIRNSLPKCRG
jgi:hypothetical protein